MRKHGHNEAEVGAAQIRLVSHRIATIISSGDGSTGTLTEFVKLFCTHSEAVVGYGGFCPIVLPRSHDRPETTISYYCSLDT